MRRNRAFKTPYGYMRTNRSSWRGITKKKKKYFDVMGTGYSTKAGAARGNRFIDMAGL